MKQILRNISALSISLLVFIGTAQTQTTILEQDGASNDFVISQWDMSTCQYCFTAADKITIAKNKLGTLNINNASNKYKNISVEIRFNKTVPGMSFSFDLAIKESGNELKKTAIIADATGTTHTYAFYIANYNNPTPFKINQMLFSNPSESIYINYIKITGEELASIDSEELNTFDVKVSPENIIVDSKMEGTLHIYNALGQVDGTYNITKGVNTLSNATQGLMFLVLTNTENKMVTRKKIMR